MSSNLLPAWLSPHSPESEAGCGRDFESLLLGLDSASKVLNRPVPRRISKATVLPRNRAWFFPCTMREHRTTQAFTFNSTKWAGTCQLANYCSRHFQNPRQHFVSYFLKKTDCGKCFSSSEKWETQTNKNEKTIKTLQSTPLPPKKKEQTPNQIKH